jgi:hypothetical protein
MAADNEFHAQLYEAADKQDIWTLVRSRSGHIDRLRRLHLPSPGKAQDIVRHHKLIARAIAEGSPKRHSNIAGAFVGNSERIAAHPQPLSRISQRLILNARRPDDRGFVVAMAGLCPSSCTRPGTAGAAISRRREVVARSV